MTRTASRSLSFLTISTFAGCNASTCQGWAEIGGRQLSRRPAERAELHARESPQPPRLTQPPRLNSTHIQCSQHGVKQLRAQFSRRECSRELSKGQKMKVTTAISATQYMKDTDAAVCLMTPLSLLLNMNISVRFS